MKETSSAVVISANWVAEAAKIKGQGALANKASFIQRWRPNLATPYGARNAPRKTPIPAKESAKPKSLRPSSGDEGSLKVLRANKSAVRVRAVNPPRCTAVARMPRAASE